MKWSEPAKWRKTARTHAREQGISTFPKFTWFVVFPLIGGFGIWVWADADPATRASVPVLMATVLGMFGFILGIGWLYVRINCTKTTTIYDHGLVHGSLTRKEWIPWSDMDYFYLNEDSIGQHTFRFLNWSRADVDDEEFSVVPDDADLEVAVKCIETNKVNKSQ